MLECGPRALQPVGDLGVRRVGERVARRAPPRRAAAAARSSLALSPRRLELRRCAGRTYPRRGGRRRRSGRHGRLLRAGGTSSSPPGAAARPSGSTRTRALARGGRGRRAGSRRWSAGSPGPTMSAASERLDVLRRVQARHEVADELPDDADRVLVEEVQREGRAGRGRSRSSASVAPSR